MTRRKLTARQVREEMPNISFNRLLGVELVRTHRDGVTIGCPVRSELLNLGGALHGGVSATLADAAVGIAIHRHFGERRRITTVEMKINYFRPVTEGHVFARSHLLRAGSRLCVGRVDITDSRGRAVGAAMVTYMVLDRGTEASA